MMSAGLWRAMIRQKRQSLTKIPPGPCYTTVSTERLDEKECPDGYVSEVQAPHPQERQSHQAGLDLVSQDLPRPSRQARRRDRLGVTGANGPRAARSLHCHGRAETLIAIARILTTEPDLTEALRRVAREVAADPDHGAGSSCSIASRTGRV
jgi:hypothetical protein